MCYTDWNEQMDLSALNQTGSRPLYPLPTIYMSRKYTINIRVEITMYGRLDAELDEGCIRLSFPIDSLGLPSPKDMIKHLIEQDTFDVTIVCIAPQDSTAALSKPLTLRAHRSVLSARSPVFATMLNSTLSEGVTGVIEVKDVEYEVMKEVVLFIYSNEFSSSYPRVLGQLGQQLLYVAAMYQIVSLVSLCEAYFVSTVAVDNAVPLTRMAKEFGLTQLQAATDAFIADHASEIAKSYALQGCAPVEGSTEDSTQDGA